MSLIVNVFEEIPGQYLKNTFTRPKRDLVGTFISRTGIGCFQMVKSLGRVCTETTRSSVIYRPIKYLR